MNEQKMTPERTLRKVHVKARIAKPTRRETSEPLKVIWISLSRIEHRLSGVHQERDYRSDGFTLIFLVNVIVNFFKTARLCLLWNGYGAVQSRVVVRDLLWWRNLFLG